jgi:hypothetical protein
MNIYRIAIPAALGLFAALANFMALRSASASVEIVVTSADLQPGDVVTPEHLTRTRVQAKGPFEVAAVRFADHGVLLGRKVNRSLKKGEVLFYRDVEDEAERIRSNLRRDEITRTVEAPAAIIAPGLRVGDEVVFVFEDTRPAAKGAENTGTRLLGPYRLVGLQKKAGSTRSAYQVVVAIAAPNGRPGPEGLALQQATRGAKAAPLVGVEHFGRAR